MYINVFYCFVVIQHLVIRHVRTSGTHFANTKHLNIHKNNMHGKVWDETTRRIPNFNSWGLISNFTTYFIMVIITYLCWDFNKCMLANGNPGAPLSVSWAMMNVECYNCKHFVFIFWQGVDYRNWPRYGLCWSGWYCNPEQHELCRPSRGRLRPRRPAQRVLFRIAVPTTTAQTV